MVQDNFSRVSYSLRQSSKSGITSLVTWTNAFAIRGFAIMGTRGLTLVFLKGVVTTPLTVCRRLHQNAKQSDPGHLSNLFYILCGHFHEKKNPGVLPNTG